MSQITRTHKQSSGRAGMRDARESVRDCARASERMTRQRNHDDPQVLPGTARTLEAAGARWCFESSVHSTVSAAAVPQRLTLPHAQNW